QRHRRLLRLDAVAPAALAGFSLAGGARRRLAFALGRLHHDALRPQSRARGPPGRLSAVSTVLKRQGMRDFPRVSVRPPGLRSHARRGDDGERHIVWRVFQNPTTRSAVEGISLAKFTRALSMSDGAATRLGPSRSRISARTVAHSSPMVLPMIR